MELKFIKGDSCPKCGCTTVIEEQVEIDRDTRKVRTHCNGGTFETRRFACGFKLVYIPNFLETREHEWDSTCHNCQEYRDKHLLKQKTAATIAGYLDRLKGDKEVMDMVREDVKHYLPGGIYYVEIKDRGNK